LNVRLHGFLVKFNRLSEIHLCDDSYVCAVEDRGVLQGLIFSFCNGEENEAKIFSEVIGRRADKIAYIFNEEKVELADVPSVERVVDHRGFEVAESPGRYLLHGGLTTRQPNCVVLGSQVTNQGGYAVLWAQESERLFEKGCLARTGA
jgi:hypothetical protein